jgi:glyoxylase-like metal-dependent hydrolase (beta-lactamase superfamily II)
MIFYSLFSTFGFSNSYLLGAEGGGDAILIDPGVFDAQLLKAVEGNRLYVRRILVTHAHNAHINGIKTLLKVYDAEIYSNQPSVLDFPAHHVQDGDVLSFGGFSIEVLETPGHSIDSLCFLLGRFLFTGDTMNAGGIGRVRDGYARGLLLSSIRKRILPLGDETFLFPGHGPPSKIGIEKAFNPYLGDKL